MSSDDSDEIGQEQDYVSMLYGRLDDLRERALRRLADLLRQTGGTHQARSERDSAVARHAEQVAVYGAVEHGLCFGRLDFDNGERRYIGRIGIFDESNEYEPLLVDWRAPAARPFYLATAANHGGVRRRRHIRTKLRTVCGIEDEVLDPSAAEPGGLTGEAALLAALNARRTGRMRDIVETIQAEQDHVIRAPLAGVLVVQGGPGTGKTAVALHRAAYLLYTYRERLTKQGVLIVGPNTTFLRYISQVLPSLAETGVLLWTVADLYPGVTARRAEPVDVAAVKGRPVMAEVLAAAVRDRQLVPEDPVEIPFERQTLRLDPAICRAARERARRTGLPHNLARPVFTHHVVGALARELAERIGADPFADDPLGGDDAPGAGSLLLDQADVDKLRRDLAADAGVRAALDELWPVLTPQELLTDLFASADRLATAAPQLTEADRALLRRAPGGGWTPADVPLLDEAAELLGEDDSAQRARDEMLRRARIAQAQGVLDILAGSAAHEMDELTEREDLLHPTDLLDAARLAARQEEADQRTAAQRAAADRTWAFGHVIVDEAQELSPMAWRVLMRRCPSRSMTVVGDVAQTGDPAGTTSWAEVLAPYVDGRWRMAELTVNYRTPVEIMSLAARVLPDAGHPRSVRETGVAPWTRRVASARLGDRLVEAVLAERDGGAVGVIVPVSRRDELGAAVAATLPEVAVGDDLDVEGRVAVLTVRQAKGLEFDSVIVVDPAAILAESPRGRNDLYVALTRATQRLGILHPGALPPLLKSPEGSG